MQGIFLSGRRPKSKKEVRERLASDPASVRVEATSIFGNEWEGYACDLPKNQEVYFVGPDPSLKRSFYGKLFRNREGLLRVQ